MMPLLSLSLARRSVATRVRARALAVRRRPSRSGGRRSRCRRHVQRARLSAAHDAGRRAAATAPHGTAPTAQNRGGNRHRGQRQLGNGNGNGNGAGNGNGRATDATSATPSRDAAEPAPPPKPSEFQRFVEGATGRLLPIFGAPFFADAADTFQSLDNVPVSADYTIGPGDEIVTRAWGSIDVDYRSTVDRNGMLNLPKVGSFNVAGVKAADLEKNLRAQIARLYTNFDLSVSLGQLRGLRVFIVGPAQRPGVVTLSSQSTLLSAVVAAGGPSAERLDAQDPAAPRRQGRSPSSTSTSSWSRATSRRTCSSPPATSSSSSPPGRASRSPARSTRRRSTS